MKYNYRFQGYSISQMRSIHSTTSNTLIIYNCMAYGQLLPIEHMACPFLTLTSPFRLKCFVMHELDLMHESWAGSFPLMNYAKLNSLIAEAAAHQNFTVSSSYFSTQGFTHLYSQILCPFYRTNLSLLKHVGTFLSLQDL